VRRLIIFSASIILILLATTLLVLYGKGYRFNFDEKKIAGTGILSMSSTPSGAEVYLNGELRGATNTNIQNLPPGKYKVTLAKEGFSDWEKEVEIVKERVTPIEASLFPSAPNLSALTFSGVASPKLSPDGQKIAYTVENKEKTGLWVLDTGNRQLIFSKAPQHVAKDTGEFSFSKSDFIWSGDSSSLLVSGKNSAGKLRNYLLDAGKLNESFTDVSSGSQQLKAGWQDDEKIKKSDRLKRLGKEIEAKTKGAEKTLFSPDEERVLIISKTKKPLVYDTKPSLIPGTKPAYFEIPQALDYIWYPSTGRHIILVKKDSIGIVEADGQNDKTIYTGEFNREAVFPWPDGSRLVIATTLNNAVSKKPNLYSISLR